MYYCPIGGGVLGKVDLYLCQINPGLLLLRLLPCLVSPLPGSGPWSTSRSPLPGLKTQTRTVIAKCFLLGQFWSTGQLGLTLQPTLRAPRICERRMFACQVTIERETCEILRIRKLRMFLKMKKFCYGWEIQNFTRTASRNLSCNFQTFCWLSCFILPLTSINDHKQASTS